MAYVGARTMAGSAVHPAKHGSQRAVDDPRHTSAAPSSASAADFPASSVSSAATASGQRFVEARYASVRRIESRGRRSNKQKRSTDLCCDPVLLDHLGRYWAFDSMLGDDQKLRLSARLLSRPS
eukprot:scaffold6548_cov134-Pinguiococcus_pyrenoidosus.AAC.1